jgi:hypothetical protein
MRFVRFALALCTFVFAATLAPAAGSARTSGIRTNDLIVVGQVRTLKYDVLDELGMNGEITAQLTITRVLRGRPPSSKLTIKYVAHSPLAEDRDVRFHLPPL